MMGSEAQQRPEHPQGDSGGPAIRAADRARVCVGCAERVPLAYARLELLRFVLIDDGQGARRPVVDLRGSNEGRGAWVHARRECLERALRGGFARSAKAPVKGELADVVSQIVAASTRRLGSLLRSAVRSRAALVGGSAFEQVGENGGIRLVLIARDAKSSARRPAVAQLAEAGKALPFATKDELGGMLGRKEVGVLAIVDEGLAGAVRHAIGLIETRDWVQKNGNSSKDSSKLGGSGLTPRPEQR